MAGRRKQCRTNVTKKVSMEVVNLERRKDGIKKGRHGGKGERRKKGMNDGHKELGGRREGGEGC